MSLSSVLKDHDDQIEAVTTAFSRHLDKLLSRASRAVATRLILSIEMEDGRIARSPANRRVLREVGKLLMTQLAADGLQQLLDALADRFNGQFTYLTDVLRETLGEKLAERAAAMKLTQEERVYLAMQQGDAVQGIQDLVASAANQAKKNVLFGIGGLSAEDLANTIADTFDKTSGQVKTDAATAMSTFFRTAADMSYRKIEADENFEVRYKYAGPPASDPVIRPFCEHLMDEVQDGRTWTRAEIDAMDNEQLANVFVTGGGYNCRHSFLVAEVIELQK